MFSKKTIIVCASAGMLSLSAAARAGITNFEPPTFTPGSVDGQGGWSASTGGTTYDEEVQDDGSGTNQVWRLSNAVTSGSFSDQPHSSPTGMIHGETVAIFQPDGTTPPDTDHFYTSFNFSSATGAAQSDLSISISPDDGQGSRQSYIRLDDTGSGIDVAFDDSQNNSAANANGGFVETTVATGLSYTDTHTIGLDIQFVDGVTSTGTSFSGNDIVKVFVDGNLVHTGTTWESYYLTTTEGQTPPSVRSIDRLVFRAAAPAVPGNADGGYYFDNVTTAAVPTPSAALAGMAMMGLMSFRRRRRERQLA